MPKPPSPGDHLVAAIRDALAAVGDPQRAAQQQAYMKSALPYRGITSAQRTALLRPLLNSPDHHITERADHERAVRTLMDTATWRDEWAAAIALTGHRSARPWQDIKALDLYRHIITTGAWWDVVDPISADRVGPILLQHNEIADPIIRAWAIDDDLWIRRSAILSQLAAKARTDTDLLRHTIEANLDGTRHGHTFWIRKAIGWALRQHARTDPDWTRATVADLGDALSGLSRREALKHL